jgi:hypothetical protein
MPDATITEFLRLFRDFDDSLGVIITHNERLLAALQQTRTGAREIIQTMEQAQSQTVEIPAPPVECN